MTDPAVHPALVAELARRTQVSWLSYDGRRRPAWHAWSDGALCVVGEGEEQPLPGLAEADRVLVAMRSKDTGGLLLEWHAAVEVLSPGDEAWPGTTAALLARRLNLADPRGAVDRWAATSTVCRLVPVRDVQ